MNQALPPIVHFGIQTPHPRIQFDSLTSLRGIAAILTIFIHLVAIWAGLFPSMQSWDTLQRFAQHAYLFVDFFFILSGFVMCHAYGDRFKNKVSRKEYSYFLRARLARVYPLHAVILGIYVALALAGIRQEVENPEGSILVNALLLQGTGIYDHATWNVPAWSISVEWWTYTVFPLTFMLWHRFFPRLRWALAVLVLCASAFVLMSSSVGHANITVGLALLRCCLGFFAGVSLYRLFQARVTEPPANELTLTLFALLGVTLIVLPSPLADIAAFMLFCCLVYVTSKTAQSRQWLNARPLVWLGDVSYSIYLWHTLVLHLIGKLALKVKIHFPWSTEQDVYVFMMLLIVFWLVLGTLAYASHRFIEVPGRRYVIGKARVPSQAGAPMMTTLPPEGETAFNDARTSP